MISASIDVSDVLSKLARLSDNDLERVIANAIADEAVLPEVAKYPTKVRKAQPFTSAKQRRGFFARLRSGAITVPYQRTGNLGASGVKEPFQSGLNVTFTAPYAEIVIGEKQSKYFDYWPNVTKVAEKIEGDTAEVIATAKVLEKLQEAGLL
jgi:hypothetical protein